MDLTKIRTRAFPVHEDQGLIWIYYAREEDAGKPPAVEPPKLDIPEGEKPRLVVRDVFNCHVDHAVIGLMDPAHIPYIHRQWWWRSAKSVHEKEKKFGPVERGFTMLPHTPSKNSYLYRLLGEPQTEIRFQLPGLRTEYVNAGGKHFTGFTAVTPTNENSTAITIVVYWNHPLIHAIPNFLLKMGISIFVGHDRDAVNAQQVGLAYDPKLMLIHDADVQAKWYFALKRAWDKHRDTGEDFSESRQARHPALEKLMLPIDDILTGLLYIAMIAVVAVLAFGIINLYRGDEKARSRSNKLMRLRIVLQFSAILIIIAIFLVRQNFGG